MMDDLSALYLNGQGMNLHPNLVKVFSRVVQQIASATDLRDLYAAKGRRMEKLRGRREGQYSIRLNDQYRLIFTVIEDAFGHLIVIIEICDYH